MEFENYRYPEGEEDKPTQEKPIKIMDHAMDALRYALMTMKHRFTYGFLDVGKVKARPDGSPALDKTHDMRILVCLNCNIHFRTMRTFEEGTKEQICKDCQVRRDHKQIKWDGKSYSNS